jgi:Fe-S-cluster containining protein
MLSPTGKCTVYSVRPYICRLWGATKELACPQGCQPERWLTIAESMDIFQRIRAIAGPETAGPAGSLADLWDAIGLERRAERSAIIEKIKEVVNARDS